MVTKISEITREFIEQIKRNAEKGVYRIDLGGIIIDVFPYVFPPASPFSRSSGIYNQIGYLTGKDVLDIGTGTGIQAIQAALSGARSVEAVDINRIAVDCAKHNVRLNKVENMIRIYESDLFSQVPAENKYHLIIANLPILDHPEEDLRFHSIFDPDFSYHKRLFSDARRYLTYDGKLIVYHANLKKPSDFTTLENLASRNGFGYRVTQTVHDLGYEWRAYEFKSKEEA